jgi:hypothetical protein
MKLPSQTYKPEYLNAMGFTKPLHGQKTRFMYWVELLQTYRKDALVLLFPLAYRCSDKEVCLLSELVLANDDEVKEEFLRLLSGRLSWVGALIKQWWPYLPTVKNSPLPPDAFSEVSASAAIELAIAFNGKGIVFAVARYLAPAFVSEKVATPKPYSVFTQFADLLISSHPDYEKALRSTVQLSFPGYTYLLPPSAKGGEGTVPDLIPSVVSDIKP